MKSDVKCQPLVIPAEQLRDQDKVTGTGDGEKFGEALDDTQNHRAKEVHRSRACEG
jgi:hypothetical protein